MQNTVANWSKPELILVVTNLHEWPSAMPHALRQAKVSGAAVLLAHITRPCTTLSNPLDRSPIALRVGTIGSIQTTLGQLASIFEREGISCEPVLLNGIPIEQIRLLVESRRVDRVIVASSSPQGVARLLVGSPAEELASVLDVPVCIVGPGAYTDPLRDTGPVRILAAMSLETTAPSCALFAAALAGAHHGLLTMLHVLEPERMLLGPKEHLPHEAECRLEAFLQSGEGSRCQAEIAIRQGDPSTEILELASSLSAEFIVLSSPRDAAVSRVLRDSVVHRVVREARCPVIVLTASACDSVAISSAFGQTSRSLRQISPAIQMATEQVTEDSVALCG